MKEGLPLVQNNGKTKRIGQHKEDLDWMETNKGFLGFHLGCEREFQTGLVLLRSRCLWWDIPVHFPFVVLLQDPIRNFGEHFLGESPQEFPSNVQTSEDGSDVVRVLLLSKEEDQNHFRGFGQSLPGK